MLNRPDLDRSTVSIAQDGADTVVATATDGGPLAVLENVQASDIDPLPLVKSLYGLLESGDIDGVIELLADDVLWESPGPTDLLPWAGRWEGRGAVKEFFARQAEGLDVTTFTPTRFIAQGNTVAVIIDEKGTAKTTGRSYAGGVAQYITVKGGKISALQFYMDTFPVVEAIMGGRPFTVPPTPERTYYVVVPLPSVRSTDSIVFDPAELESPPDAVLVVRRMYAALQALDVPKVREVFAPDVLWDIFGPGDLLSWASPRRGPDAAAESANQILETMHFDHFKPTRSIYDGDTVVITIDEGGTSTATGKTFMTSVIHIVTVKEGRVVLFRNYINTTEIVEAFLGGRPFTVGVPS